MSGSTLVTIVLVLAVGAATWLTWRRGRRAPRQQLLSELAACFDLRFVTTTGRELGCIEGRIDGYAVRVWTTGSRPWRLAVPPRVFVATLLPTALAVGTELWRRTASLETNSTVRGGGAVTGDPVFDQRFGARGNLLALKRVLTPQVRELLMAPESHRGSSLKLDHEWILQQFPAIPEDAEVLKQSLRWQVQLADQLWQAATE